MALTWEVTDVLSGSVRAKCTAPASETFAKAATDGVSVANATSVEVFVEAEVGQTITAVGPLLAWVLNDISGVWARAPGFDITIPAGVVGQRGGTDIGPSAGKGIPIIGRRGRMAWTTGTGWTVSSGSLYVPHNICRARAPV